MTAPSMMKPELLYEKAVPGAVLGAAVRVELSLQILLDLASCLVELLRREPRHLQHFELQTHCSTLR